MRPQNWTSESTVQIRKIVHVDCGTMWPIGQRFIGDDTPARKDGKIVCHVLILETDGGLVLIDSGMGTQDIRTGSGRLPWFFRTFVRPELTLEQTAVFHVQKLGYSAEDVKHIILTHLDIDHAGGLSDFPNAQVHVSRLEWDTAMTSKNPRYNERQTAHLTAENLHLYGAPDTQWCGLDAHELSGDLLGDIKLISLPGHSRGHCGVAVKTGEDWMLHAGDAYFHTESLQPEGQGQIPQALRLFERVVADDYDAVVQSRQNLRDLALSNHKVTMFCSHDNLELRRSMRR